MNKSDFKLIGIVIVIFLITILGFNLFEKGSKFARVYYQNEMVLEINLSDHRYREYNVEGYNGNVLIISENGKVKVEQENSPLHLCSKQGWIDSSFETIVCLPNKIVIKIETKEDMDTIVK